MSLFEILNFSSSVNPSLIILLPKEIINGRAGGKPISAGSVSLVQVVPFKIGDGSRHTNMTTASVELAKRWGRSGLLPMKTRDMHESSRSSIFLFTSNDVALWLQDPTKITPRRLWS